MRLVPLLLFLFLVGCATTSGFRSDSLPFSAAECSRRILNARTLSPEEQLNEISRFYKSACYSEVIQLGGRVRDARRDKIFKITAEIGEIFTPEGTFTDYVLESYERAFLSVLIAMSHSRLGQSDAAMVELRRAQEEESALIYNFGADPAMALLQAAVDRFRVAPA